MRIDEFSNLYRRNNLPEESLQKAILFLNEANTYTHESFHLELDHISIDQLDQLIQYESNEKTFTVDEIVVLMRYYRVISEHTLFIHLTKYTGSLGVTESILERAKRMLDDKTYQTLIGRIHIPPFGTPPKHMPELTKKMMEDMESILTPKQLKSILSGNHHQIPKEAFLGEKVIYEQSETLDDYLRDLHQRKVQELTDHYEKNKVWFEQEITPEVINFVKQNQEVLSAVRRGNELKITKIPYDTKKYLEAETQAEKAYFACHCPFVREAVKDQASFLNDAWCNCSAGFTKFPFEVIFDQELDATCTKNAIRHDDICEFVISLEGVNYKK